MMSRHVAICILAVSCAALVSSCGQEAVAPDRPHVILISLDTVRRDAVGVYRESATSPTPNLDRFATDCVRFDQAWAPVPFTLTSHMSLLTGLDPETHGVTKRTHVLDPGIPTMTELAAAAGYHTIGLVSNLWMKGSFGFDRGFDHYERVRVGLTYAERINSRLFELLDQGGRDDRPLFLFLHYIDAHSDYHKEGENTLPYHASSDLLAETGLTRDSGRFCDQEGNCATAFLTAANRGRLPVDRATIDLLHRLYLSGISLLDLELGRLFAGLEERGLLDRSLVVVTSDHGEELREHGRFVHAQPYVECLAVPLLVRFPGAENAGATVSAPVELADLMPSILAAIGIQPPSGLPSRDVFTELGGETAGSRARVLGRDKIHPLRFAIRDVEHTLILDLGTGVSELYDRRQDPGETTDVSARHPETVATLESALRETLDGHRRLRDSLRIAASTAAETPDALSPEEAEHLRAIGYLE